VLLYRVAAIVDVAGRRPRPAPADGRTKRALSLAGLALAAAAGSIHAVVAVADRTLDLVSNVFGPAGQPDDEAILPDGRAIAPPSPAVAVAVAPPSPSPEPRDRAALAGPGGVRPTPVPSPSPTPKPALPVGTRRRLDVLLVGTDAGPDRWSCGPTR
jgi:hypothetical protein